MIVWSEQKRKLSELKPYDENPRKVPKDTYEALVKNIKTNGYTNRLIINTDNVVLGGNQRLRALKELGYNEIDVLVPSVELTEEQEDRINITDNLSAGVWDFDMLHNLCNNEGLIEWGFPEILLNGVVFDEDEGKSKKESVKKLKECPACGEQF